MIDLKTVDVLTTNLKSLIISGEHNNHGGVASHIVVEPDTDLSGGTFILMEENKKGKWANTHIVLTREETVALRDALDLIIK